MFRAELVQCGDESLLKMEGRLIGDWADEVRTLITRGPVYKRLIVDLTEISYADSVGEQVLSWLNSLGARFVAKGVYSAGICKRLGLALHMRPVPKKPAFRGVLAAQEGTD